MNAQQVVAAIGRTWMGLGAVTFAAGVLGFLGSFVQDAQASPLPVRFAPVDFLFRHHRAATAVQACVAVLVVLSGWMLVRRRPWAAVVVQLLSACVLAWIVVFGIYWFRMLGTITPAPRFPPAMGATFRVIFGVGGAVVLGALACAFGLCIVLLNRRDVREELRPRPMHGGDRDSRMDPRATR